MMTTLCKKFDSLDEVLTYIANVNTEFNDFVENLDMYDHDSYDDFVKVAMKEILDCGVPSIFHENFPNTYQVTLNPYQINIRPPYCNYGFSIRPIASKGTITYIGKIHFNLDPNMLEFNPIYSKLFKDGFEIEERRPKKPRN